MNLYIYILNATNNAQKVAFLLLFVFMTENACEYVKTRLLLFISI